MPTVHGQQNIKSLNKYRISITDFSFSPRVHHGIAELLILHHFSLSPTIESPTGQVPAYTFKAACPYALSWCSKKSSGDLLQRF